MNQNVNSITRKIIGSAITIHKELGPGLLESSYEACMAYELARLNLKVERQKGLPLVYRSIKLDCGDRVDFIVEDRVILELKAVEKLESIHEARILSYLKLSKCEVGLLINFNVRLIKNGIRRFINRVLE
jgi:GxxExxY protein